NTLRKTFRQPLIYFLIPLSLLAIALFSRLYDLGSFPHFTPGLPMCGDWPPCSGHAVFGLPGLYDDEVMNFMYSFSFSDALSNVGGGPLAPIIIAAFTHILGATDTIIRLPFAVASAVTSVLVYYTTNEITHGSKMSAVLSASYFIVMMPALVYGRMAYGEDLIALLFILTFLATLKIKHGLSNSTPIRVWFVVAAISSALSVIVKLDGGIVVLYFLLFLYKERLLRRGYPYFGLTVVLGGVIPFTVLLIAGKGISYFQTHVGPFVTTMGNQLIVYRAFFLDALPSGVPIFWASTTQVDTSGLFTPEYWYVFLYIALGAMIFYNFKQYSDLTLAVGTFVVFVGFFSGPVGNYWMIMILPLLAIAFGPGVKYLLKIPLVAAFGFYTFLYIPLAASLGIALIAPSLIGEFYIQNSNLNIWNLLVLVPPAAFFFLTARMNVANTRWRILVNGVLIVIFFAVLVAATFFVKDLYPYYT
ncbi:MAG: glycosyltransferase family 39 protein, partial [Nitrososphaerota archaeon]|nr:glycosyltransferase family 39 protein [Nitrososphaerota archaeon]